MLTLKNVLPDGSEHIIEVHSSTLEKQDNLNYDPHIHSDVEGESEYNRRYLPVVTGLLDNGVTYMCTEGTVYVMNSSGKTVANYSLMMRPNNLV